MFLKLRYVLRAYRYRLRVDPAELRFVCSQLKRGQTAADIGCHKGAYTFWMRRCVGATGAVFAFEPQPRQVAYLQNAFAAMGYDNVPIVPMALSNICGELPLHLPYGAGLTHAASLEPRFVAADVQNSGAESPTTSAFSTVTVPVTTLDTFFAEQDRGPDFLKIDVEGHELPLLEGAANTLRQHRPAILIECEARHRIDGDVQTVFELLQAHGYKGSFFLNGCRRPLEDFEPEKHQYVPAGATSLPRDYVNNFAFVHGSTDGN